MILLVELILTVVAKPLAKLQLIPLEKVSVEIKNTKRMTYSLQVQELVTLLVEEIGQKIELFQTL